MIVELNTDSVKWEMDWSGTNQDGTRQFPDMPEKEIVFEPERALALLLLKDIVFLNNHWWKKDKWPNEACEKFSINVNCSDVFALGGADAEELDYEELEDLYNHWEQDNTWGSIIWCIRKRRELPHPIVQKRISEAGKWDLNQISEDWST